MSDRDMVKFLEQEERDLSPAKSLSKNQQPQQSPQGVKRPAVGLLAKCRGCDHAYSEEQFKSPNGKSRITKAPWMLRVHVSGFEPLGSCFLWTRREVAAIC